MALRVCNEPGCPELTDQPKCETHKAQVERDRGTRQQRGYDLAYDKNRKTQATKVAKGRVICWSCGHRISPLEPWHNGHCENDRTVIHGPEHPNCNLGHVGQACPHPAHTPGG